MLLAAIPLYLYARTAPTEGDMAPDFSLKNERGEIISLKQLLQSAEYVVLVFYPKDDSPGCTEQFCSLRDLAPTIPDTVKIVGISGDALAQHIKFKEKYQLPFPLLSDADGSARKAYGAYSFWRIPSRTTFIINKKGIITKKYQGMLSISDHIEVVKELLKKAR